MNDAVKLDLQDKTSHISSSLMKYPESILYEYAAKNCLRLPVVWYDLVYDGILQNKISFKCWLILDAYVSVGEGASKKEAKLDSVFEMLSQMIKDKPDILNIVSKQLYLEKDVGSPFNNTIKVNTISQSNDFCRDEKLKLPAYNLVHDKGHARAKPFTTGCRVAKTIEIATHKKKQHAKHLVGLEMLNKCNISNDKSLAVENKAEVTNNSVKFLSSVKSIKLELTKKNAKNYDDLSNYHLNFKNAYWTISDTLNDVIEHYLCGDKLDIAEPYSVLKHIVRECEMSMVEKRIGIINCYTLRIVNVHSPIYGVGTDVSIENAKALAATKLLKYMFNLCSS